MANSVVERTISRVSLAASNVLNMLLANRQIPNRKSVPDANHFGKMTSYLASRGYNKDERDAILGNPDRVSRRIAIDACRKMRGEKDAPGYD